MICAEPWQRKCARSGIDRLTVSKILNHSESGITRIYDRYAADPEKAAAMERWANHLRRIVGR